MNIMNKTWLVFFVFLLCSELAFADRSVNSATVDDGATSSVTAGDTISTFVTVTTTGNGGNNDWESTGWRIDTESGCNNDANVTNASTSSVTFNTTAPSTDGTYSLFLTTYKNNNCTGSASAEFELINAVTVTGGGGSELLCSAEATKAVINEIQTQDNFIEIYLKQSADVLNWALYVDNTKVATLGLGNCEINGTAAADNTGSGVNNSIFPSGTFITCDYNLNPSNNEVLLVDTDGAFVNGDNVVIDYLGYGNLTPSAIWAVNSSCGSLYPSHNANNKDIARIPDGTGDLEDNDSRSTKGTTNEIPLPTIDHYEIYHDGSGITCLSEDINIKACTNADCSAVATDDITATLNLGPLGQAVTITSGDITPNVSYTTAGTISIGLDNLSISAPVDCYVNNIASAGCEMTLAESGFVIDIPTLTACKPNATATIRAVQSDNQTNTCGTALLGNQTVDFWSTYISPNSSTTDFLIDTNPIATSSPGTSLTLNFDSDGEAIFTVQYDDAGQIQLNAEHTMLSGVVLEGDSTFVSKPHVLTVFTDETDFECVSGDASCNRFIKAGENFDLKVNAACWESDSDTDFTDNPVTPNFELSSIAVLSSVVAPSGGSNGSLSVTSFNFSTTDNGSHTMDQAISEVGVFNFMISPSNYFGEALTTQNSPNIGRFYPDHFAITNTVNGSFENACTGFSYSGQEFSYTNNPELTITAYNAAFIPAITQNYTEDFIKLLASNFIITPPTTDALQLGLDNANLVQIAWSREAASLTDHGDGSLSFVSGDDIFNYLHVGNSRIDKFLPIVDLEFTDITDSDGVTTQGLPSTLQPSGDIIRFGRLALANTHGSELIDLPVSIQSEYFNGHNWQLNNADQCTVLTLSSDFQLSNSDTNSGNLQAGTTTMTIDGGTSSATLTNVIDGKATITFSAPGQDNQGYVDIHSNIAGTQDWLLSDNDNDGAYDDEVTGRASFGLFKGSDNIIFRREVY
jgi:hypothetical protein